MEGKLARFLAAGQALPLASRARGKATVYGKGGVGKGGRGSQQVASPKQVSELPFNERRRRLDVEGLKPEPGEPQEAWDRRVYRERAGSGETIGDYLEFMYGKPPPLPASLLDRPSAWLEDESAASSATVEREMVPRVPSPPAPDAAASDAYGGKSADCGSDVLAVLGVEAQREREQRVAERERREAEDDNDGYERVMERAWHDEGRRSFFYGKPAAELSPDAVVPPEWEPPNALEA